MTKIFIGFDFGTKNIGVAVGQEITGTASPQHSLDAKNGEPNWQEVDALIKSWEPAALVVGIPFRMDGSEQHTTHAARHFSKQLQQRYALPVHHVDERLTTKEARHQLHEQGGYAKIASSNIDSLAAKLILEQWMKTL